MLDGRYLLAGLLTCAALLQPFARPVPATQAALTAAATNPATGFATTALYAPASLTPAAAGHDVQLSWPSGQNGSGYAVLGAANGTSSDCTGATLASVGTAAGTTFTDTGRYAPQGTYVCYQVATTYAGWTSVQNNPLAAVQLGVVASSVQLANNTNSAGCSGAGSGTFGQAGKLDCGDQVVLAFNQPLDPATIPAGTTTVCANQTSNTVWLGSTATSGTCAATETVHLGKLTGGTVGGCNCRFAASFALSNGNRTLTVTLGAKTAGPGGQWPSLSAAAWAFTPTTDTTKLKSATGGFHACDSNAGGGNCLPAAPAGSTA
jgi:hypothetical protein